jgi:diacylglycerol kinase family enzyme
MVKSLYNKGKKGLSREGVSQNKGVFVGIQMNHNIKHLFIINPRSFLKKSKQNQIVSSIHQFFRERENKEYDVYVSQFPRDAVGFIPLFARNLEDGTALRVYAVGGDGILFDCLNGIMRLQNVDTELAVVPYGYTNNFIQGFDKNDRLFFRILSRQFSAPSVPMDIMRCGTNYVMSYCSVGTEAESVHRAGRVREQSEKGSFMTQWLGRSLYMPLYYMSGLGACNDKKLLRQQYELDIDGEKISGNYQSFSFFNSPFYGGNLHPVINAMPNDGILDMLTVKIQGSLQTCFLYPFYVSGHYRLFPRNFSLKQGKKFKIHSDNTLVISMDGIVFFESDLDIELLPSAVQFVDPSRFGYRGVRQ